MADAERKKMQEYSTTKYNRVLVENAFPAILILKIHNTLQTRHRESHI